ncbi:zinc-ribbon domain-containing protein [Acidovorax sp. FG27]|uniref:zinc-ribbon domain-containing protein n=1 Tax=Acidovorax sp. FG27 TaxID=3133652 RepID=UPI0030E8BCFE
MALIECAECGKQTSDKAAACPHCGAPIGPRSQLAPDAVVTTQQTSKKYKGAQMVGGALLIAGLLIGCATTNSTGGGLLGAFGLVVYLVARLLAWWEHG